MPDHDYLKTVTIGARKRQKTQSSSAIMIHTGPRFTRRNTSRSLAPSRDSRCVLNMSAPPLCLGSAPSRSSISSCSSMTPRAKSATRQRSKQLVTRCACANRIGMSTACSKASRPLSISTCSVRAATKHSACWPSATICAAMPLTANATPQKSAGSPRRNGRTFRITPTPRQLSCRRSWRTFPLCR